MLSFAAAFLRSEPRRPLLPRHHPPSLPSLHPSPTIAFCCFPLIYATKIIASGIVDIFHELSKIAALPDSSLVEKLDRIFDVVLRLLPFFSLLDPPLVFEVGINMLSLADIPGGKLEWALASIITPHPLGSVGVLVCQRKHREGHHHESLPSRS